jgi:methylated-DNA-protein-cysteine methyltransferase-like protein
MRKIEDLSNPLWLLGQIFVIVVRAMVESTLRIIKAIEDIPRGRVSCYRDIALAAGFPNGARQVVWVLHSLSRARDLPWHRIIRADGRIALPPGEGRELQIALLRGEGVEVDETGRVDLKKYGSFHP